MLPPPNTLGPGTFEPNEVNADRLFAKLEQRTAELILSGPPTDDDGWFWLLLDGTEE